MSYKDKLFPWCIINPQPGMHTRIVGRFRRRSDAEGHLQLLRRLIPHLHFEIMFDVPVENSQSADMHKLMPSNSNLDKSHLPNTAKVKPASTP